MEILMAFLGFAICWGIIDHIFFMPKRKKAAEDGNAEAQYELGRHHDLSNTYHVSNEAIEWYLKAAKQGHKGAILRLAEIKREEENSRFSHELEELGRRLAEANKNGDLEEQYQLGVEIYENDRWNTLDDLAIRFFLRAARQGHEEALARLKEIESINNRMLI